MRSESCNVSYNSHQNETLFTGRHSINNHGIIMSESHNPSYKSHSNKLLLLSHWQNLSQLLWLYLANYLPTVITDCSNNV